MAHPKPDTSAVAAPVDDPRTEANIRRLQRGPSLANDAPASDRASPTSRSPAARTPEPAPAQSPPDHEHAAAPATAKRSLRRPLLFALLPLALSSAAISMSPAAR